jgi:ubiquinone/menaquinone biosynthesis C-methylase UbiE
MSKQKKVFLEGEGDAWFDRNHDAIQAREFGDRDAIIHALLRCQPFIGGGKLLEVGCGEGKRLRWISENLGMECHGIDPSAKAVGMSREVGVLAVQGTADELPYLDETFDFLIFGFCLYLCDRDDLFTIAREANRVLKPDAWLIIHDFFSEKPTKRAYHHLDGIYSFKMDYRSLFDWHPYYTCFFHELRDHRSGGLTDDPGEWVGTSILRKKSTA